METWRELITALMRDFRKSSLDLENETGIPNSIISNLKTGKTKHPQQKTIQKLEDALGIVIEDNGRNQLRYYRKSDKNDVKGSVKLEAYPVSTKLISGEEIMRIDNAEVAYFEYSKPKESCYVYISQVNVLHGLINEGDKLLIDTTAVLRNGNVAACVLKNETFKIGRYTELEDSIVLISEETPEVIKRSDIFFIYKVSAIHKPL